ncbi:MAG: zinc metallopeptidase, partial [Ruminococcus sp.]|nr:zinc metallopeptidase [Ruminococcus sp.]
HEAGHAVQHAQGYFPNKLRSAILPLARLGSTLSWILIAVGLLIPNFGNFVLDLGIIFFAMSMLFTLVTLPVEFNASSRALKCIKETNMLSAEEYPGARSVLQAAAMTYVAAALTSILQFLRLLLIVNNRRD